MEKKRFKHVTVKIRVSVDGSNISSALTPGEFDEIIRIRNKMGISLSHTVSSLIKQGLRYRKVKLDDNVESKQSKPEPNKTLNNTESSKVYPFLNVYTSDATVKMSNEHGEPYEPNSESGMPDTTPDTTGDD